MELKIKPNKLTEPQREWIARLNTAGVWAACYYPDDWPEIDELLY